MSLGFKKWQRSALGIAAVVLTIVVGLRVWGNPRWIGMYGNDIDVPQSLSSPSQNAASDNGDEAVVRTTVWSEKIDVFLERPHVVAGKSVELLFHLTAIDTGRPVTEGNLAIIASGPDEVEIRSEKPARPGIFISKATFTKPGMYHFGVRLDSPQIEGGGESIELPPLEVHAGSAEASSASQDALQPTAAEEIHFLKEQQWRIGLKTHVARTRELIERLNVPGRIIVPQGSGAIVGAPITGKALPPPGKEFPKVGDRVEKNQVLAVVEPSVAGADAVQLVANQAQLQTLDADLAARQLEIETKIKAAELSLKRAQDTARRKKTLTDDGVTAGKELIAAEHEVLLAQAELDGFRQVLLPYKDARKRLAAVLGATQEPCDSGGGDGSLRVTLRSPIAGTIVEANITAGELIHNDRKLFYLVNLDTLWIEANVSEYDLGRVQRSPGASLRLAAYPDAIMPITDGGGRLIDIGAVVDPDTRTVPIRYEISNPDGALRVGMYADLLLETDRRHTVLTVPKEAVLNESGETVVYIQRGGETFERRHVEVGVHDGNLAEIRSGLTAGDRVVSKGAFTIRLATLSGSISAHGHAH